MHDNKPNFIAVVTVSSIGAILFLIFFVLFVNSYLGFDLSYEDLSYEELTFDRYEFISGRNARYDIFVKEYSKPLEVSNITQKGLKRIALTQLKENDVVKVYYRESSDDDYQFTLCEIKSDDVTVLSLSDYVAVNKSNQVIGMVICPIMSFLCLSIIFIFIRLSKTLKKHEIDKNDLGVVRIEYEVDGNVIQIFNSPSVCSLVINGAIADQYFGIVATRFTLNGHVTVNDKKIPVEAKMGHLNMRLYYNGELVAKEFMGLG